MLRFQRSRLVSSIGAAEAMPALETRMSSPPNSTAVAAKAAATAASEVTSISTVRTTSAECRAERFAPVSASAAWSMSASMTQAPSAR